MQEKEPNVFRATMWDGNDKIDQVVLTDAQLEQNLRDLLLLLVEEGRISKTIFDELLEDLEISEGNRERIDMLKGIFVKLIQANRDLLEYCKFLRQTTNASAAMLVNQDRRFKRFKILALLVGLFGFFGLGYYANQINDKNNEIKHQKRSINICQGWLKDERAKCAAKVKNCIFIKDVRPLTPLENKKMLREACKMLKTSTKPQKTTPPKKWPARKPQHR
jgi:hypothetical protein